MELRLTSGTSTLRLGLYFRSRPLADLARAGCLYHASQVSLRLYPPSELHAGEGAFRLLTEDIVACRLGSADETPWLFDKNGAAYPVLIYERSLEPKFEVFSLEILSLSELSDRQARWTVPILPDEFPEDLRALISTQPQPPVAPLPSASWPFQNWRVDVLKRVEFMVEGVSAIGAVGGAPNTQGAVRPGEVPPDAAATCEVAAALLFSDVGGDRLLIGVDWMPYHIVVSRDPAKIDAYHERCIAVPLRRDGTPNETTAIHP